MSYNLELSKKCINEHEAEKAKLSRQVAEERPSTKLRMPNSGVESRLLQNARRDELKSKRLIEQVDSKDELEDQIYAIPSCKPLLEYHGNISIELNALAIFCRVIHNT
ncbi:10178_t:CDS:2 [Rhizophagus irregularis]|nr:10178_t:CDS:2 [Rhizophagus irregularis]